MGNSIFNFCSHLRVLLTRKHGNFKLCTNRNADLCIMYSSWVLEKSTWNDWFKLKTKELDLKLRNYPGSCLLFIFADDPDQWHGSFDCSKLFVVSTIYQKFKIFSKWKTIQTINKVPCEQHLNVGLSCFWS